MVVIENGVFVCILIVFFLLVFFNVEFLLLRLDILYLYGFFLDDFWFLRYSREEILKFVECDIFKEFKWFVFCCISEYGWLFVIGVFNVLEI